MLKSYYAVTDKGPYYNNNQDAFIINQEYHVFGVIDGFGGTGIGDVVSSQISKTVQEVFTKSSADQDATLKYYYDSRRSVECNFLVNGVLGFHETLMLENEQKSLYQRGGASCIFLINQGERVSVLSVGKIYGILIRSNTVRLMSLVDDGISLMQTDSLSISDAWTKSGIGLFSPLQYFINEFPTMSGDKILLATQGACNFINESSLLECMLESTDKNALLELFKRANFLGNRDNQTAILLSY
jgi:serine/threonine protein phosphatase PrpC